MALIYPQNGDLKKLLKSSRKKVPQSARLSAGGGGQKLKGQCPNAPSMNLRGASLTCNSPKQRIGEIFCQPDREYNPEKQRKVVKRFGFLLQMAHR